MLCIKEQFNKTDSVVFLSCQKRLRFGNDKVSVVSSCALVPVASLDTTLYCCGYITPGCTPFPLSRPVMELL